MRKLMLFLVLAVAAGGCEVPGREILGPGGPSEAFEIDEGGLIVQVVSGPSGTLQRGQTGSIRFRIRLDSYNAPYTDVRWSVSQTQPALHISSPTEDVFGLFGGDYRDVVVTFQVPYAAPSNGTQVVLHAEIPGTLTGRGSASHSVSTMAFLVVPPRVSFSGPSTLQPGTTSTLKYTVYNPSSVGISVALSLSSTDEAVVPSQTKTLSIAPGSPATASFAVTPSIHLAGGRQASVTARATESDWGLNGSRTDIVSIASQLANPQVRAEDPSTTVLYGATERARFQVTNNSNSARTFVLVATSSNRYVVADPRDPGTVTIPAFGTTTVLVDVRGVSLGTATIYLRATDTGSGHTHTGGLPVTVSAW